MFSLTSWSGKNTLFHIFVGALITGLTLTSHAAGPPDQLQQEDANHLQRMLEKTNEQSHMNPTHPCQTNTPPSTVIDEKFLEFFKANCAHYIGKPPEKLLENTNPLLAEKPSHSGCGKICPKTPKGKEIGVCFYTSAAGSYYLVLPSGCDQLGMGNFNAPKLGWDVSKHTAVVIRESVLDPDPKKSWALASEKEGLRVRNLANLQSKDASAEYIVEAPFAQCEEDERLVTIETVQYGDLAKHREDVAPIDVTLAIWKGLRHLHNQGIVHRDIKPGNILISPKKEIKIADFGLATSLDQRRTLGHNYDLMDTVPLSMKLGSQPLTDADFKHLDLVNAAKTVYFSITGKQDSLGQTYNRFWKQWKPLEINQVQKEIEIEKKNGIKGEYTQFIEKGHKALKSTMVDEYQKFRKNNQENMKKSPAVRVLIDLLDPQYILKHPKFNPEEVDAAIKYFQEAKSKDEKLSIVPLGEMPEITPDQVWPRPGAKKNPEPAMEGGYLPEFNLNHKKNPADTQPAPDRGYSEGFNE